MCRAMSGNFEERMRKVKWRWHHGSLTCGSLDVRSSLADLDRVVKNRGPFPEETWFSSLRGKWVWPRCPSVGLEWFTLHLQLNLPVSCFTSFAFPALLVNSQVSWKRSKDNWAVTEQKMWESSFAVWQTGWLDALGECKGWWKRRFFDPFFFPYPSRRYFFPVSHKSVWLSWRWSRDISAICQFVVSAACGVWVGIQSAWVPGMLVVLGIGNLCAADMSY